MAASDKNSWLLNVNQYLRKGNKFIDRDMWLYEIEFANSEKWKFRIPLHKELEFLVVISTIFDPNLMIQYHTYLKKPKFRFMFRSFFICYLAAPRLTLG